MGRKRKPIEQLKREGNYKACRHRGPELEANELPVPEDMEGVVADTWKELSPVLASMGILTKADGLALRMLCESFSYYAEACETVKEKGAYSKQVNKNGSEYISEHPAVKARSRYWKEVESIAKQFGLTPSARTGLHVSKPNGREMSALDQILRGGRN